MYFVSSCHLDTFLDEMKELWIYRFMYLAEYKVVKGAGDGKGLLIAQKGTMHALNLFVLKFPFRDHNQYIAGDTIIS